MTETGMHRIAGQIAGVAGGGEIPLAPRQRARLALQGFGKLDHGDWGAVAPWLRVAPGVCAVWALVATLAGSGAGFFWLGVVAAVGAVAPVHPIDLPYHLIAHRAFGGPSIPSYGTPRRFACVVAALWALLTAGVYHSEWIVLASALGITFALVAAIPATVDFCVPSWLYRALGRILPLPPVTESGCPRRVGGP